MNILLLMTDQWRWDTLFDREHPCQTPNLDGFAHESISFPNTFTSCPLCCPARASLMTGKWPHQTGVMDNIAGGSFYPHGKLHLGQRTFLERLRDDAGYAIAYSGKWHLGQRTLLERGIENVCFSDGGMPQGRGLETKLDGETLSPYYGSFSTGVHRDERIVTAGMEQIAKLAQADRPFCAVISTPGPHFPHFIPREFAELYRDLPGDLLPANYSPPFSEPGKPKAQSKPLWPCQNTVPLTPDDWRKTCAHYWGYCTFLDSLLGRVFEQLDALGLVSNTIVAFTADHGEMLGAHGFFDKGPYFYEEIMHIPMIVRDPRGRQPATPEGFINLKNLFPTLIDLAGAGEILAEEERHRSYWITGNDSTFYTYDAYHGRELKFRGIRTERWKYHWSPHDLSELYDLEQDPHERNNRIDVPEHTEIQEGLHSQLMAWMEKEGDYLRDSQHLLPVGCYVDGRDFTDQHDPGWSEEAREWLKMATSR